MQHKHSCVCVCSVVYDSLQSYGMETAELFCPWNFPRQECWSGWSFPSPGDLPDPGIELESPGGLDIKSCPTLVTTGTITCQAPLSMGFPRQEYWSGLLFSSPEDLPNPGIEPGSLTLQADSSLIQGKPYTFLDVPQACGILVPWLGVGPRPPALEAQSANHWTNRDVPSL